MAGLAVLAAWLRFAYCGEPSLWWDEFITLGASLRPLGESLSVLRHFGPSDIVVEMFPPLHHVITHALAFAGGSDTLLRLPGILAGAATVPALYALVRGPLGRLSALSCAMLLSLSVYHIHYSRELRPYALFMLENVLALHVLYCLTAGATEGAIGGRRPRMLAWYGVLVAAMLYTSYLASMLVFAQALFAGGWLALKAARPGPQRREALGTAMGLALALACAAAAYLPWVPAQALLYKAVHDPSQAQAISLDFIAGSLKEFAGFAYRGEFPAGWAFAALAVLGFAAATLSRGAAFPLMAALWGLMPLVGVLLAQTRMDLSSRYIFPVFLFLTIFAGHSLAAGVAAAGRLLFGAGPEIFAARAVAAAALCAWVSAPNIESLGEYYSRETSGYKQLVSWLMENRDNTDRLLFAIPRQLKLVTRWYGGDALAGAGDVSGQGYSRAYMLSPRSVDVAALQGAVGRGRIVDTDIVSLGIARAPVLPMAPDGLGIFSYSDRFTTLRFYEDVFQARNQASSVMEKVLTPYEPGREASCEYAFRLPPGGVITSARLSLEFSLVLRAGEETDAAVRVSVARGDGPFTVAAEVTGRDFRDASGALVAADRFMCRRIALDRDILPLVAGQGDLRLRFEFGPCGRGGPIEVGGFTLDTSLGGPPVSKDWGVAETLAQLPVAPWTSGRAMVLSKALHAFALDESFRAPRVGSPADRVSFRNLHPDAKPVRILRYPDGSPAVELYDPALADPSMEVRPVLGAMMEAFPASPRQVRALKLEGVLDAPVVGLGESSLPLPVSSPTPSLLAMSDTGQAELTLSPLYDGDFNCSAVADASGVKKVSGEDCLVCEGSKPCFVTYGADFGYPVRFVRVLAFPRVVSRTDGKNSVRTLLSLDGGPWRKINSYTGAGSGRWEGLKIPQYTYVALNRPAARVRVRFELSGPDVQLWSAPDSGMRIDFGLAGPKALFGSVEGWPLRLSVSNPTPLRVMLLDTPLVFPDRLKRTR
jgi:hypothetical protein